MNKKGVGLIATVLLVMMVLVTVSYALYSFAVSSEKISYIISGDSLNEVVLAKEQIVKFYLGEAAKNAFIKTYPDFVKNGEYIENSIKTSDYFEFKELNSKLNQKFSEKFKENFIEEFKKYEFEEDYLKSLKDKIADSKINYGDGKITIEINDWETLDKSESVVVYYKPKINFEIDFKDFGVDSFEKLKEAKDICVKIEDNGECYFKNLNYFNSVELKDASGISYIHLSSKNQFLIDSDFKKIEFDFIPV